MDEKERLQEALARKIAQIEASYWRKLNQGVYHGNRKPNPPDNSDSADRARAALERTVKALSTGARTPKIPREGIRAGEIIGHRMWWVLEDLTLCSMAHLFRWEPGKPVYGDVDGVIHHGFFERRLGVYSWKERVDLELEAFVAGMPVKAGRSALTLGVIGDTPAVLHGLVLGTIKMWGEVVEHDRGYRAEWAKIDDLDGYYGGTLTNLDEIKKKYGV